MIIEFERCRKQVCGKVVTVTSWQDANTGSWTAAVPSYSHMFTNAAPIPHGRSREEAVGLVVRLLSDYLDAEQAQAGM